MLLALYDAAIAAITSGAKACQDGDTTQRDACRLKSQRLVLGIIDGLALDSEGPQRDVLRLCLFVFDELRSDSSNRWAKSAEILSTLRDGFAEIQLEAREAELAGQIPSIESAV